MAALAKTSSPRPNGAIRRERLFSLLDRRHSHPVIWVCAPAGAGKTTLVASYLEANKVPALWYRVDPSDSDPAALFYYLSQAAAATTHKREPLPLLAPEYAHDLAGFARRFFRKFFDRLPPASVLVFDDCEKVSGQFPFHTIMSHAFAEIPDGLSVIVISREEAPAELSRLAVSGVLEVVSGEALRLTLEEARSIAALQTSVDESVVRALHDKSEGWVTGLLLMSKHGAVDSADRLCIDGDDVLLDYFQNELFSHFDAATQKLLLRTALMPRFTAAMAERISGDGNAQMLLNGLCRRQSFIHRSAGPAPVYQYHALFQKFLVARLTQTYDSSERTRLLRRSAKLLEAGGQIEDAFACYRQARDWNGAARLIVDHAPALFAQGRRGTLVSWIEELPQDHFHQDFPPEVAAREPWLLYWSGACQGAVNPGAARDTLVHAFAGFKETGQQIGQLMAAAEMIETYVAESANFHPLDRWIDVTEELLAADPVFPAPATELRVRSAMLLAMLFRQPCHPMLHPCAERVRLLLARVDDLNRKASAGYALLTYAFLVGDRALGERLSGELRPLLSDLRVAALNRIRLRIGYAYQLHPSAGHAQALQLLEQARQISVEDGLRFIEPLLSLYQAYVSICAGDSNRAEALLEAAQPVLNSARLLDLGLYHAARAWLTLLHGDTAATIEHHRTALALASDCGWNDVYLLRLSSLVEAYAESGMHESAEKTLGELTTRIEQTQSVYQRFYALLVHAYALLRRGDDATIPLRRALELGRQNGLMNTRRWRSLVMSRLCAAALASNIEPAYACSLIKRRGLIPESPEIEHWPWPIKIYTLGRFLLARDAAPSHASGKTQQVPLELLKALIALGGRGVEVAKLEEALWPQAEGDAARKALDTTLHRLRKLLGVDEAVTVREGKLTLDGRYCWVDTWVLERRLSRVEEALGSGNEQELQEQAEAIFALYQDHFLVNEPERPWMLGQRDRLRSKFVRHIKALGQHWERTGDVDRAIVLYEKGLEIDNLAEELYRRLMRLHERKGHRAEAMATYRRCRQSLSVVLGISPAPDTQAIFQSLSS
jgi:ATP/maltotriose-dependent transcriptional regulator MalT/DNA-binding SARP family transcriptional activator